MDCETCALYYYDEDYEDYICSADMDEDDVYRIMSNKREACILCVAPFSYGILALRT